MRWSTVRLLAAAVMAAGAVGVLARCSAGSTGSAEDLPNPPASVPTAAPSADPADERIRGDAVARAPLGLEIRYVDENGRFATLVPGNFPR